MTDDFEMESIYPDDATFEQITACTKWIRVYSNNPIHDCIDRIIDACSFIDENRGDVYEHLFELSQAAEKLAFLAERKSVSNAYSEKLKLNEQKSN